MPGVREGDLLWTPSPQRVEQSNITCYLRWLKQRKGLDFASYEELWEWSVTDLEGFWRSVAEYFQVFPEPFEGAVISDREMPGARWFEGTQLNYVSLLQRPLPDRAGLVAVSEDSPPREIPLREVLRMAAAFQELLVEKGVSFGDRVAGYLPNTEEAVYAFLAAAASGAVWSCCSPEFGTTAVLDRLGQIEPTVLVATSRYRYGGKIHDRTEELACIVGELESLEAIVLVGAGLDHERNEETRKVLSRAAPRLHVILWHEYLKSTSGAGGLSVRPVPFDHPLWILYSSGTTGLPKPIVHGHGGIVLEHLKALSLHMDLGPANRFFWYTSTGWMMWNFLVSGLLVGSSVVLYQGSPFWPDPLALWRLAEQTGIDCFGVSGPYIHACMKEGVHPAREADLSRLKTVGSTGAPLSPEGFAWLYEEVSPDLLVASISGGTDVCTAFVGSCPLLPVHAGEIQCRCLGAAVDSYDEDGKPLRDAMGELVLTEPLPSMPVFFWNDPDMKRYRESYFSTFPGVWRHGDWIKITPRGSCVIYGRSDSTLNRGGVRMGTAEFYRVVESLPEVEDSLVVDLSGKDGDGELLLFVVPARGSSVQAGLRDRIVSALRTQLSPRHVPDEIVEVSAIPKTINGKKMEVPVKKILMGADPERAASKGSMADPSALEEYVRLARPRSFGNRGVGRQ